MSFEKETKNSPWKKIHLTFNICSVFHRGKKGSRVHKNKVYNQIRLVTIQDIVYLEVKTQKTEITFFCEISDYTKLHQHVWYTYKTTKCNTYYIATYIKKDNKQKILY